MEKKYNDFYVLRTGIFNLPNLYKIYFYEKTFYCARISGPAYDEESGKTLLDPLVSPWGRIGCFLYPFIKNWIKERKALEEFYDHIEFSKVDILQMDKRNIILPAKMIDYVIIDKTGSIENSFGPYGGRIIFHLKERNCSTVRFTIQPNEITQNIQRKIATLIQDIRIKERHGW